MLGHVGKYELLEEIGSGASATVYLAFDTFSQQRVALKVIHESVFRNPAQAKFFKNQFLNEASLVGKLSHPHIVALLDAVVGDDSGYIAMEYVPGGSLARFTRAPDLLPVETAIEIGFKCCGALDYALRQGIIHRDIKPANIMVVKDTEIKLADFGAAFLHGADTTQIVNIGSPSYMSPEQISGATLADKSDMFSLGVVLYELLTGEKPFAGASTMELMHKIVREDPPPVRGLRPELPPEIDPILLRALAKRPQDRYPTWAEFALELAGIGGLSVFRQTIPDSEKFRLLRAMEMLKQFSDPQLWQLVQASRWERVPSRSVILREDEPGQSLFFLVQGEVKVTKHGRLLNVLRAGECFGEMGYIKGGSLPRQATVEALTELVVAEVGDMAAGSAGEACELHMVRALLNALVDRLILADSRITRVLN